jgi:hypothetical protein
MCDGAPLLLHFILDENESIVAGSVRSDLSLLCVSVLCCVAPVVVHQKKTKYTQIMMMLMLLLLLFRAERL